MQAALGGTSPSPSHALCMPSMVFEWSESQNCWRLQDRKREPRTGREKREELQGGRKAACVMCGLCTLIGEISIRWPE